MSGPYNTGLPHAKDAKNEKGKTLKSAFEDKVIADLKSVEELARVHSKQVLTQLRCSGHRLGLLLNFGEVRLKNGIERIVNGLPEESLLKSGFNLLAFFVSLLPFG